jgi:precorrin-2 dehydrogenase/sirohydrochlorin ferrochelatase
VEDYYPIIVKLEGRKCVVIGGGKVAYRKVFSLLSCGAKVVVISPELNKKLKEYVRMGKIEHIPRKYKSKEDLRGAFLVFSATGDQKIDERVAKDAAKLNLLVNVTSSDGGGNFINPAALRRGKLLIAVSTSGVSPALSRKIRIELEGFYGEEYKEVVNFIAEVRALLKHRIKDESLRRAFWDKFLQSDIISLIKNGRENEALQKTEKLIAEAEDDVEYPFL